MRAHISVDSVFDRLYPPHLRRLSSPRRNEVDGPLFTYIQELDTPLCAMVEEIAGRYSGNALARQLSTHCENLLIVATKFLDTEIFFLHCGALKIAARVARLGYHSDRVTKIFQEFDDRQGEEIDDRYERFQGACDVHQQTYPGARASEEIQRLYAEWVHELRLTAALLTAQASCVPAEFPGSAGLRQFARMRLLALGANNLLDLSDVIVAHLEKCSNPDLYPASSLLVGQIYDTVTRSCANSFESMTPSERVSRGWEPAVILLHLSAFLIPVTTNDPTFNQRARTEFRQTWHFMEIADRVEAEKALVDVKASVFRRQASGQDRPGNPALIKLIDELLGTQSSRASPEDRTDVAPAAQSEKPARLAYH